VNPGSEPDDGAVTVNFEFTKPEFEAAMRAMLLKLRVHRLVMAIGGALVAVGVVFLILDNDDHAFITPGLVLLAYVGLSIFLMPKRKWRSAKTVHGEQRYRFDANGMVFTTPVSETKLGWSYYPALVESERFYFFRSRGQICNPIPKRALDPAGEAQFRALVARHIDTKFRPAQ
jgi:hypothetical protein